MFGLAISAFHTEPLFCSIAGCTVLPAAPKGHMENRLSCRQSAPCRAAIGFGSGGWAVFREFPPRCHKSRQRGQKGIASRKECPQQFPQRFCDRAHLRGRARFHNNQFHKILLNSRACAALSNSKRTEAGMRHLPRPTPLFVPLQFQVREIHQAYLSFFE